MKTIQFFKIAQKILLINLVIVFVTLCQEDFEEFKKKQKEGIEQQHREFEEYNEEVTKQYQEFYREQMKAYEEYVRQITGQWGKKETKTSTNKEWVAYDKDFKGRRSIDFENGKATIEVLLTEKEAKNPALVQKRLQEELTKLVTDKGNSDPLAEKEVPPQKQPVLQDQVQTKTGEPVTAQNASQYATQTTKEAPKKQETVTTKTGEKRVAVSMQVQLVPNHLKQRAEKFRETVQQQAARWNLDASLVFAVVHTESYYNPLARSPIPALGLMQLVPTSGARDSYLYVYKQDKLVTPDYLYNPQNNVELGAAYLNLLMTKSFKNVTDPLSKMYCAIASYNTGAGNVAVTIVGKRRPDLAAVEINKMTPEQLFDKLKNQLQFAEARNYIKTVTERKALYLEWDAQR
jgi:membrane-bound lytic murein transglycosylase C